MKRYLLLLGLCTLAFTATQAQDEEKEAKQKFFRKVNLFTGGSVQFSFGNNVFLAGGSPVIGYSLTRWADVGLVVNYTYTSYRDIQTFNDKLRQKVWGGGSFIRLFPVRFLFAQAQLERNWIRLKYLPPNNGSAIKSNEQANSFLVGAGYTTGRDPENKSVFGYLAILWDLKEDANSPYTDGFGRAIPIIRAGLNVPLFQGKKER